MATQAEQDKEVAKLYLARSEGKVVQVACGDGWFDKKPSDAIRYGYRIKPQTVEEAAENYMDEIKISRGSIPLMDGDIYNAFIVGAKWQKEQDNANS